MHIVDYVERLELIIVKEAARVGRLLIDRKASETNGIQVGIWHQIRTRVHMQLQAHQSQVTNLTALVLVFYDFLVFF